MVSLMSLWLPILLAAVFVFIVSSIIHIVLTYHQNDYAALPRQDEIAAALRPFAIPPGQYILPKPASPKDMKTPEFQDKLKAGPVAMLTVFPNRPFTMNTQLVQWFVYCVVIGLFAAYVASRTLAPGTEYLQVFRITGTVAFAGYGLGQVQDAIWSGARWSTTFKALFDALIYALFTAGTFGWLWPSM
jgi:hypothetical protein